MDIVKRKITTRNLIIFVLVVILSGWVGRGLDLLMGVSSQDSLGTFLWLVSPLIVTLILRAFGGDGWKDIGLNLHLKKNLKWYVIAVLIYPFVTIVTLLIGKSLGFVDVTGFQFRVFIPLFIGVLAFSFFKNIPEEFVWRGYLSPKLFSLKINDWILYLIVGLVWGVWHIPYYLYFLSREDLTNFTSLNLNILIPLAILVMIIWSITFVELRRITDSVWPVVLLHTVEDGLNILFINNFVQFVETKEIIISPIFGIIGIILYMSIGVSLRYVRKKKEKR